VPLGAIFGARADVLSELQGAPGDLLGLDLKGSTVIRNVLVTGFPSGIRASQGTLTLKNVRVDKARHGLALSGTAKATLSQGVSQIGARGILSESKGLVRAVFASGNTWNPGIQQADGNGQYLKQPLVTGSSPNARGTNFNIPSVGSLFEIQL
jgi:hypothetical protein